MTAGPAPAKLAPADPEPVTPAAGSASRIGAVIRKELAEFRRNRFIVVTAAVFPVVFLISPTAQILAINAQTLSTVLDRRVEAALFLPLLIPVFVPAMLSAYAVVGEREQGTLEPVLTTPIGRTELLIGKATAIFMPSVALAYLMFGIFVAITQFAASSPVATTVLHAPQLPAALVFIPLLAAWAIWIGLAISTRATDMRVAQQLSILGSLPPAALAALFSFQVISPTFGLAAALAGGLLALDCVACYMVARLFDREWLITGARPARGIVAPGAAASGAPAPGIAATGASPDIRSAGEAPLPGTRHERSSMATAALELSRSGRVFGLRRPWQILLDGQPAGSITNKQTAKLPVEPGHHTLRLSAGRFTSPERTFEAAAGDTVSFTCRPPLLWPHAVAALIVPSLWISLKRR